MISLGLLIVQVVPGGAAEHAGLRGGNERAMLGNIPIKQGSKMHEWTMAGLLNTPAFLARYPTTPTNRNRARARWTFSALGPLSLSTNS